MPYINGDDSIDILDVVLLANFILDEDNTIDCADINGDGNTDVLDIVQIVNGILNGIASTLVIFIDLFLQWPR